MKINFSKAIKITDKAKTDSWYGKTMLAVPKNHGFKRGDSCTVKSDLYNGKHLCEYIYTGNSAYDLLYFRSLPYVGTTTGTVEISSTPVGIPDDNTQGGTGGNTTGGNNTGNQSNTDNKNQQIPTKSQVLSLEITRQWWFWALLIVVAIFVFKKFIKL